MIAELCHEQKMLIYTLGLITEAKNRGVLDYQGSTLTNKGIGGFDQLGPNFRPDPDEVMSWLLSIYADDVDNGMVDDDGAGDFLVTMMGFLGDYYAEIVELDILEDNDGE